MPITFNTNLAALGAQRNIGIASNAASSSLSKLSSGSRVPTAKDDAAALAIGSKLKAEVAGLAQAANNAGQAISLLQIADGALSTIGDLLQRMKALAVQSSSGQLADSERALLNQEFTNLRTEIDRVANVTNFNNNTLLNGGDVVATQTEAQLGYLNGKGITISANTAETGADEIFRVSYAYTNAATDTGVLTVTNQTTGESQSIDINSLIAAKRAQPAAGDLTNDLTAGDTVDVNFNALGVTLTLDSRFDVNQTGFNTTPTVTATAATGTLGGSTTATYIAGGAITGSTFAALSTLSSTTGLLTINVTYGANTLAVAASSGLEFSRDNVTFATTLATSATNTATAAPIYVRAGSSGTAFAQISLASTTTTTGGGTLNLDVSGMFRNVESTTTTKSFDFKVNTGVTSNDSVSFTLGAATISALSISGNTIDTASNANAAITAVNSAINTVSSRRADIGANQSRLEFASASINVAIENTTAAQSALLDVDVSSEITNFTSKQVLLQAGVSLLAQANQQPALLLRLLQ